VGLAASWLVTGVVWGSSVPAPIGIVYREQAARAGTLETRGRALESGDLLATSGQGVIVRLANGHVLRLAANSNARLEAGGDGDVGVTVLSGRAALVDGAGGLQVAGQRSRFVLTQTSADAELAERRLLAADIEGRPARPDDPR
jgi:hypothetical protein